MSKFSDKINGKRVLVFGVGRQGGGSGDAAWLKLHGAEVRLSDKDETLVQEGQTHEQINWADLIVKNPGVPDNHELLLYAKAQGKPIYTSIALFVKYADVQTIGITGTRGKSTTTALISTLLNQAFPGAVVTGGNMPGSSGLALFDQQANKLYAVLELSSFQLHNFHELEVSPHIAVITNLYPDHLNRYQNMADYARDKVAAVAYQKEGDFALCNADNAGALAICQNAKGKVITYSAADVLDWQTSLTGAHNRENLAAMWAVGKTLGLNQSLCRRVAREFAGLPFRQEKVRELKGVTFINDTTATTPTAAIKALQTLQTPVIWIAGGDTKNLPFDDLLAEVKTNKHLKNIVILGSKNIPSFTDGLRKIAGAKIIGQVSSMEDAVTIAVQVASPGDTVLLSPGFSSFDLFQNEFDRGQQFNAIVKRL